MSQNHVTVNKVRHEFVRNSRAEPLGCSACSLARFVKSGVDCPHPCTPTERADHVDGYYQQVTP